PKVIALIDGYFMQNLSVWHKELLFALDKGVLLYGSSSMGALRAAETADFGMIGVGKVYELYRDGSLNDDDEVALAHGPAEEEYLPLSLPLVNIRFTLERAHRECKIPKEVCQQIFTYAQSLYYPNRTVDEIAACAKKAGLSERDVSVWLTQYYVDQKKEDALLLLQTIKTLPKTKKPAENKFNPTSLFQILYNYDRRSYFGTTSLTQRQIAHHVALHHPDFAELLFQAKNRMLVHTLAKLLRIEVTNEEIEEEKKRFCTRHALLILSEEEWDEWRTRNHLSREDFEELIRERAEARKVEHAITAGVTPWKTTKALLDELKLRNQYEGWAQKAAHAQSLFEETCPCYHDIDHEELHDETLIEEHLHTTNWSPDCPYPRWAEEAGFENLSELKMEIHKAKLIRQAQETAKTQTFTFPFSDLADG
ncbi:MAG: TfuA-like protein, partial [Chlamydiales bacterium]